MVRKKEEASHQKAFFQWLACNVPIVYRVAWHCPNGGKRNAIEGAKFKEMGVKPGVPDVFIAIPMPPYHGLFIEFKSGKNTLTSAQKSLIYELTGEGYKVEICYSVDEAIEATKNYFFKSDI